MDETPSILRIHIGSVFSYPRPVPGLLNELVLNNFGKLNCLWTGVGQYHLSMQKWGLAPSLNCKCGAAEQVTDYVLIACLLHQAPHGA